MSKNKSLNMSHREGKKLTVALMDDELVIYKTTSKDLYKLIQVFAEYLATKYQPGFDIAVTEKKR